MKRKYIFLVLLLLLTTGCSINYNLEINDDEIIETTTFAQSVNSEYTQSYMNTLYNQEYPIYYDETYYDEEYWAMQSEVPKDKKIEGQTYYEKQIDTSNGNYTAIYKATFNFDNYKRSRMLDTAFATYSVGYDSDEKTYYIKANNFKLYKNNKDLSNVRITITLNDCEVIESNETSKNGNTYIWIFNRNSDNKISLKYKKNGTETTPTKKPEVKIEEVPLSKYAMYIFSGVLLIIVYVGYKIFNKMKDKNNQMDD